MEVVIGLLIGFAIGATGVGGGTLMVPALIFLLGFQARTAVATALLFSTCVKILGSGVYFWHRKVDIRTLAYLLYGGLPGAIIGRPCGNLSQCCAMHDVIYFSGTMGLEA
jgi:uncharacterized membrane protein YfcA